ncbi:MAG: tetratricopeptide repeat protein [Terriglobia bacterium]|jgi:tetratricopeptide (TPR) repeat protein
MPNLRLTQFADGNDRYRVEIAFEDEGSPRRTAVSHFAFAVSEKDREDLRWYLEDYLQYPLDPAPKIAARIEARIAEIGRDLFGRIFQSNDDARDLWTTTRAKLADTRVEIVTDVREATAIPWELIRDPKTDMPLALRAKAFVRASSQAALTPYLPKKASGPIRILLVICRPRRGDDVPFRSVASRLLKGLSGADPDAVRLELLRPPTFEELARKLREARDRDEPYHVVHFDGHGAYGESDQRPGEHGYLMFENPALDRNLEPVDGTALGGLLAETNVPVLVLNACRSAHADPPAAPVQVASAPNPHAEARAFGSLAQEIMDAGVAGVVAMRYNVYVETAANLVADVYSGLVRGLGLGEAVTFGRKQLVAQPLRSIAFDPLRLEDWPVPVAFEAAPVTLFRKRAGAPALKISLGKGKAAPGRGTLDKDLPKPPDAGFFGRDETLYELDRAFDSQHVVLLHAYAGSGKTTTAAEFARWYTLTGGLEGRVLFTSFEQYRPLARVLDSFGQMFNSALEQAGFNWLAHDDSERREAALQVMQQIPLLWIWDNVEPVGGFPKGTASKWSQEEQGALADFLRDACETKAKFLLTSRRDEQAWLHDLPARIPVPPMPFMERVQLARALAVKAGRRLNEIEDWRPLLLFTAGNPMTITALVGQALRDGLRTKAQIGEFVRKLGAGEAQIKDEESEGRTRSLAASLNYGFEHAFSEPERKQLALLHLFQGFADVDALCWMGESDGEWCLPEVRGLTRQAGITVLDRAAEVGLLTAHGGGYYSIHPALPWFFKKLFDAYYGKSEDRAIRAYVEAIGGLGSYYHNAYGDGRRDVIGALQAEEANLLRARELARSHGWWRRAISTMQGLDDLYDHTGRRAEWARLVEEIVPDFVDPGSDGPLPGREDWWSFVTQYRVPLAREVRQWEKAERLQRMNVEWRRERALAALATPPEKLDHGERHTIRTLVASVHELGQIQRELGQPACVESYRESYELALRIGDSPAAATAAFNLGTAYTDMAEIRDLAEAERWYNRDLELESDEDSLGRARCLGQLGRVSYGRFEDAREAGKPPAELAKHLQSALDLYNQALKLIPENAIDDLAVSHNALGGIYNAAGDLDRALAHYRESIRYRESAGDLYGAAKTQFNTAVALARRGRFHDAKEYALAALRNYQTYGEGAKDDVLKTLKLIAYIDNAMKPGP